jgi:hypothetical protein
MDGGHHRSTLISRLVLPCDTASRPILGMSPEIMLIVAWRGLKKPRMQSIGYFMSGCLEERVGGFLLPDVTIYILYTKIL